MTKVPSFNRVAQLRSVVDDEDRSPTPDSVHEVVGERKFDMMAGCRSVFEYEQLNKIDEGTYGVVFRARDKGTGAIRALKKVKMDKEREGFPLTALREANILLSMQHPNVVGVTEMVMGNSLDSIFMVMEFAEHDLKGLMETMTKPFTIPEVKCLMLQLLGGVSYLHDNWVLHRDLKTSNVLVNNKGELKICDFGLAEAVLGSAEAVHAHGGDALVPRPRAAPRPTALQHRSRRVEPRVHHG
jgi:cell division cycle 2-like protein